MADPRMRAGPNADDCDTSGKENGKAIAEVMAQRVPVWRVRPTEGGAWLIEEKLENLAPLLDSETDVGHGYVLERVEMTRGELENMGEFDGW